MKILFSVNKEDYDTGSIEHVESVLVQTNWSALQIDNHIALYDGFRSEVTIGEQFSVFTYYCYFDLCDDLIEKIRTIPNADTGEKHIRTPLLFRIRTFDPGDTDAPEYPEDDHQYLFDLSRYECGASGFEAIVFWAASHPIEMVFIGGALYDTFKWLVGKILACCGAKRANTTMRPIVLNTKRLYKNFARLTHSNLRNCQITKINRLQVGIFHVKMCTTEGKQFKLKCYANGKIESFEEIQIAN